MHYGPEPLCNTLVNRLTMAKKKYQPTPEELEAQNEALADAVAEMAQKQEAQEAAIANLKKENAQLRQAPRMTDSVSIAPAAPVAPERPVFTRNGKKYQFISGALLIAGRRCLTADIAADPEWLEEVVTKYPACVREVK